MAASDSTTWRLSSARVLAWVRVRVRVRVRVGASARRGEFPNPNPNRNPDPNTNPNPNPNPNPDPNPNPNRNPNPNAKPEPDLALGLLERHVDERLVLVRRVPVGELGDEARLHRVVHALEGAVLVVGLQSEERLGLLSDGGTVRDEAQDAELDVARVARDGDEVALWLG